MKTRTLVAILMVMLSLAAAALIGTAADADVDVILLPSDGGQGLAGNEVTTLESAAAEAWEEEKKSGEKDAATEKSVVLGDDTRPWACCNTSVCTETLPLTCHCLDEVDKCDGACRKCEPSVLNPFRLMCNDEYHGDPGPKCDHVPSAASRSFAAAAQLLLAFVVLLLIQSYY